MNKFVRSFSLLLAVAFLAGLFALSAEAAKKPVVPGGRNQLKGVDEGKVGDMLFNGTSRFRVISVEYPAAGPKGEKAGAGNKWIAIEVEVKNAHDFTSSYGGPNCKLQLVDADDQLFEKMRNVSKSDWKKFESPRRLLPAAGLKAFYIGEIAQDYKPVRLIYIVEPKVPVYRVNL